MPQVQFWPISEDLDGGEKPRWTLALRLTRLTQPISTPNGAVVLALPLDLKTSELRVCEKGWADGYQIGGL